MNIDFKKYADGLVPAIIQDVNTQKVLMLGFMNEAAVAKTIESGKVTFFSRSKDRLWTKGEESGNYLSFKEMLIDCDNDSLLIKAAATGPVCHNGTDTCWGETNSGSFLQQLTGIIQQRKNDLSGKSYVASLFKKGINKIAQKVGEEAVELVIEAKDNDAALFKNEAADLLFHYMILLEAKGTSLTEIENLLRTRHKAMNNE